MARKLKNLKITKVDFVDAGANPDANIVLIKRKDDEPESEAPKGILQRMMAWFTKNVEKQDDTEDRPEEEPESTEEELEKSASSFGEELSLRNLDRIADDMWNLCGALNNSLCSILCDGELDSAQKQAAMLASLEEFTTTTKGAVASWAGGSPVGLIIKSDGDAAMDGLTDCVTDVMAKSLERVFPRMPPQSEGSADPEMKEPKGEGPDMKIDKSRLTPEELAALEAIEKKAGVPDEAPAGGDTPPAPASGQEPQPAAKSASAAPAAQTEPVSAPAANDAGDIYKGMTPEARDLLESLRKFKEDAEDAAIRKAASGFEIIGKTPDALFPILKSLKASSPAAYDQMLSTLNDAKAAVEKSGVFSELGRTGDGSFTGGGAVKEAEAKAAELMKSKTGLTRQQAIDQVLQADPDLAKRYETEE